MKSIRPTPYRPTATANDAYRLTLANAVQIIIRQTTILSLGRLYCWKSKRKNSVCRQNVMNLKKVSVPSNFVYATRTIIEQLQSYPSAVLKPSGPMSSEFCFVVTAICFRTKNLQIVYVKYTFSCYVVSWLDIFLFIHTCIGGWYATYCGGQKYFFELKRGFSTIISDFTMNFCSQLSYLMIFKKAVRIKRAIVPILTKPNK